MMSCSTSCRRGSIASGPAKNAKAANCAGFVRRRSIGSTRACHPPAPHGRGPVTCARKSQPFGEQLGDKGDRDHRRRCPRAIVSPSRRACWGDQASPGSHNEAAPLLLATPRLAFTLYGTRKRSRVPPARGRPETTIYSNWHDGGLTGYASVVTLVVAPADALPKQAVSSTGWDPSLAKVNMLLTGDGGPKTTGCPAHNPHRRPFERGAPAH